MNQRLMIHTMAYRVNTVLAIGQVCFLTNCESQSHVIFISILDCPDHWTGQFRVRKWIGKWLYNLWFQKNICISFTMWSSNNELDTFTTERFTFSRYSHFINIYLNQVQLLDQTCLLTRDHKFRIEIKWTKLAISKQVQHVILNSFKHFSGPKYKTLGTIHHGISYKTYKMLKAILVVIISTKTVIFIHWLNETLKHEMDVSLHL